MGRDLLDLLRGHEAAVQKLVAQADTLPAFLRSFVPLVQRLSQASALCAAEQGQAAWLRNAATVGVVVQQLAALGWEKVLALDDALRSIEVLLPSSLSTPPDLDGERMSSHSLLLSLVAAPACVRGQQGPAPRPRTDTGRRPPAHGAAVPGAAAGAL